DAGTFSSRPLTSLRATVSWRTPRSAAAWALPRPSASASAKFAKITVNHSHRETCAVNHVGRAPAEGATRSRSQMRVGSTLATSTTNMTGFFAITRGSSLRRLSTRAARIRGPSQAETARTLLLLMGSEHLSGVGQEMLDDRAQAEGRKESEGSDDHYHAYEK